MAVIILLFLAIILFAFALWPKTIINAITNAYFSKNFDTRTGEYIGSNPNIVAASRKVAATKQAVDDSLIELVSSLEETMKNYGNDLPPDHFFKNIKELCINNNCFTREFLPASIYDEIIKREKKIAEKEKENAEFDVKFKAAQENIINEFKSYSSFTAKDLETLIYFRDEGYIEDFTKVFKFILKYIRKKENIDVISKILMNEIWPGMTYEMLVDSRGKPEKKLESFTKNKKKMKLYFDGHRNRLKNIEYNLEVSVIDNIVNSYKFNDVDSWQELNEDFSQKIQFKNLMEIIAKLLKEEGEKIKNGSKCRE